MEFVPVGTQVGFSPNELGKLWNALANLALHVSLPTNKNDNISRYGDAKKMKAKISEVLDEIKRIDTGTLTSSGMGEELSFVCFCGTKVA